MSLEKKEIRRKFREAVFTRDGNKCVKCNETQDLDAHHITDRKLFKNGGYVAENGITLCKKHHLSAEFGGKLSAKILYKKIKSSFELAKRKDNELNG